VRDGACMMPFIHFGNEQHKLRMSSTSYTHNIVRKEGLLSHFPMSLEHCGSTKVVIIGLTVIISLILRLKTSNGQGAWVARFGAREAVRHPRGSLAILMDDEFRRWSWELLVPVHIITTNVAATSSAWDGDALSKVTRHWGCLGQHRLCPRC
jgi:hypothetical protein